MTELQRVCSAENGEPVGYGNAPKQHRRKPGQSGNPKGRPKGSRNRKTLYAAFAGALEVPTLTE